MHIHCPKCQGLFEVAAPAGPELRCPACHSTFFLDGQVTTDAPASGPRRLGKYELLEVIGQGAFGTVWRGRDPELGREVAIKVPRAGEMAGPHELERFLREARAAAQLRHPAIVTVHDVGQADGVPFLVSELVRGMTLADLLSGRRPSFPESAGLIASIAEALQYAHAQGVVHRDIKPSNVLLSEDGSPRVMDFGLARREGAEATVTQEGQVLGTPAYMSPEQARGEGHAADGRTDVYALGVVLYQCLTGELPFRGTARMLLHQVLHDEPRAPRSLNDAVPRDLETITLKAMAKEVDRRYPSAGALADDLRRWLKGEPILARPIGRVGRLLLWARRQPVVAGLSAAVVAVTLVGTAAFGWQFYEAVQARRVAVANEADARAAEGREREERQRAVDGAEATREALYVTRCNLAAAALQAGDTERARELLDAMADDREPRDLRGIEWHLLRRLADNGRRIELEGADGGEPKGERKRILFSADGRFAMRQEGSQLRVWATSTGRTARRIDLPPGSLVHVPSGLSGASAWMPVGFLVGPEKERSVLLDIETGRMTPFPGVRVPFRAQSQVLLFDPTGRRGLWIGLPGPRALVFDAKTGQRIADLQLPKAGPSRPLIHWSEDGNWLCVPAQAIFRPGGKGPEHEVHLFDPATGQRRFTDLASTTHVTFSRDGRRLAMNALGRETVVFVRDIKSGEDVAAIVPGPDLQEEIRAGDFLLSDDGEKLLIGNRLYDLSRRAPPRLVHGLKWSRRLAPPELGETFPYLRSPLGGLIPHQPVPPPRLSAEGRLWTFDPRGVVTVRDLRAGHFRVSGVSLDKQSGLHDGRTGAAALVGTTAGKWRTERSHWLLDLRGQRHEQLLSYPKEDWEEIYEPALSADGNRAVFQTFPRPFTNESWQLHPRPDQPWGQRLTRAEGVGMLTMYATGASPLLPGAHALALAGASRLRWLSPSIKPSEDTESEVRVRDVARRRWAFRQRFQRTWFHSTSLSPRGEWLWLFGTSPGRFHPRVFHIDDGREVTLDALPNQERGQAMNGAFSADGRRFAWSADGAKDNAYRGKPTPKRLPTLLVMWDLKTGRRLGIARFPEAARDCLMLSLAFSPDGERLAGMLGTYAPAAPGKPYQLLRRSLVVWKVGTNGELAVEREHDLGAWLPVPSDSARGRLLLFSPDGQHLAACVGQPNNHTAVHVWEISSGAKRHTFRVAGGPNHYRDFLAFTRDSRRLLTGHRLWDVKTGLELLTLSEALVGGRNESGPAHAYLLDGDVIRGVFAGKDDVRVYVFDGTR